MTWPSWPVEAIGHPIWSRNMKLSKAVITMYIVDQVSSADEVLVSQNRV